MASGSFACSLLLIVSFAAKPETLDPREIVRRSVNHDLANSERARQYTYVENIKERKYNPEGKVIKAESETKDVLFVYGLPYTRVTMRDGKPLPPADERKEEEKLQKLIDKRSHEGDAERTKRLAEHEKKRSERREFLREIPNAFDFKLVGEDNIGGRSVYVITADPRPGYKPTSMKTAVMAKFKGKLWIDKTEFQWVKAECESLDTVSFGLIVARLAKGAVLRFEQAYVNNEVWLPKSIFIKIDGRLAFFKRDIVEIEQSMSNYRKFQTDSKIVIK